MKKSKKALAIVLFILGALFFGVAFSLFKEGSIGPGIVALVFAAGCFYIPARQIIDHVSQKKASGQNWIGLPIAAISLPLVFGCIGLTSNSSEKKDSLPETTEIVASNTETDISSSNEETTTVAETPTPVPTNTPTPEPTPTPVPTEEPTETTTTATTKATTEETTKATTKETKKATTATTKATAAPTETVAPAETPVETPAETAKLTEAPVVVAPATDATTVAVVSESRDYVLNNNTMKFHKPNCPSVSKIKEGNREDRNCKREELINAGYAPCGNCHP